MLIKETGRGVGALLLVSLDCDGISAQGFDFVREHGAALLHLRHQGCLRTVDCSQQGDGLLVECAGGDPCQIGIEAGLDDDGLIDQPGKLIEVTFCEGYNLFLSDCMPGPELLRYRWRMIFSHDSLSSHK